MRFLTDFQEDSATQMRRTFQRMEDLQEEEEEESEVAQTHAVIWSSSSVLDGLAKS